VDIILLPVVTLDTTPDNALKTMREARRSAAVVVGSAPLGLITSLSVRKAKNQKLPNLRNAEREPLAVLFDGEFISQGYMALNLPDTSYVTVREQLLQTFPGMGHRQLNVAPSDVPTFEQVLPAGVQQAFLGYDRGAAVVITKHETIAAQSAGPPPDCCCTNRQFPHEDTTGRKKTGQLCDQCEYKVEC
jgi:CBS domain-containing protein